MNFMNRDKKIIYILGILCVLSFTAWTQTLSLPSGKAVSVVEYELPLGKKLFYTATTESWYTKGSSVSKEELQIWAVRRNENGNLLLFLRNNSSFSMIDEDGDRKDFPAESYWATCDFYSNGHTDPSWTLNNMWRLDLYLPNLFIPLPQYFSADYGTWDFSGKKFGERDRYTLHKPSISDTIWTIEVIHETPLDPIYIMDTKGFIYLNINQGLPIYKKIESTREYGRYAGKGTTIITLDSIVDLDTVWVKNFMRELSIYVQADSIYNELMTQAEIEIVDADFLLAKAEMTLKEAREKVTIPDIQQQLDDEIAGYSEDAQYITEATQRKAELVNKPSVTWTAHDFGGAMHSFEHYQGRVVLLDFWYRACPWCIRAMPQIKQIAQYFKGKPVAVLGMNVDKDKDDALFVIDKLKLMYTNLSAGEVAQQYGVRGYPTLIIIDQKGIVRDIHIGYSDDLYDKVVKSVESLLEKD